MPVSISPSDAEVFLREFENTEASATATPTGFSTVSSLSWTSSPPLPPDVDVTIAPANASLTISWDVVEDLFPITDVKHSEEGEEVSAGSWEALPEGSRVTHLIVNPAVQRDYLVTVTATGMDTTIPPIPATFTRNYMVQIVQQHDINRDILDGEVNA